MNSYAFFSGAYGQLRGYGRRRIRRQVERNAGLSAAELAAAAQRGFEQRVRIALQRFPEYARVVELAGQRMPEGAELLPSSLPAWTRTNQRRLFESLAGPPVPGSFIHSTGGSTGEPLRFYVTRESFEWRTAVSDRGYSWAGAEEGRRSFYVWGTPIRAPRPLTRLKQNVHHGLQRRTYFDSFNFGDAEKEACCRAINRVKPRAIVGYAGNLIELPRFAGGARGLLAWRSDAVVTAAEGLQPGGRELLEQHLGRAVFMSYGSREFMLIGMECAEHRGYHLATDNLLVEVADEAGRPLPPGETGRILITDLHNAANPFIRYEIGDLGALMPADYRCPCGRPFPLLARVEGRAQEVIELPDGSRLTALFIPHLM
jgi:phenylacetate-CoA ligase